MDAGITELRLAKGVLVPIVRKLVSTSVPPAAYGNKPVRLRSLSTFLGQEGRLSSAQVEKVCKEIVAKAVAAQGRGGSPALVEGQDALAAALAVRLHALGDLTIDEAFAYDMNETRFARRLWDAGGHVELPDRLEPWFESLAVLVCRDLLAHFTTLPGFEARAHIETVSRVSHLQNGVHALTEELRATRRTEAGDDIDFEERYANWAAKWFNRIQIMGLPAEFEQKIWQLDTAYLTLEADAGYATGPGGAPIGRLQDTATVLLGNERVLLRGAAGSGKTTLAHWLVVTVARQQELTLEKEEFKAKVPFLLQLRKLPKKWSTIQLIGPEQLVEAVGCRMPAPAGWADRLLRGGRAIVVVDGVDEVPQAERAAAREWLDQMLTTYPGNRWLVTTRPSAVPVDWLEAHDFAEFSLTRMRRENVALFVRRWHEAAGVDARQGEELIAAIHSTPQLSQLAKDPLLCGLLCALYERRQGTLPSGRRQLYDDALKMLLVERDRWRKVSRAEDIDLPEEAAFAMLQHIAWHMVEEELPEISAEHAVDFFRDILPRYPAVAEQGTPQQVLRHLLNRSGVLRAPEHNRVEFIHRTFQDYLAALALGRNKRMKRLKEQAHNDVWEDVLRMALVTGDQSRREELLTYLLEEENHQLWSKAASLRITLLVLSSIDGYIELEPEFHRRIEALRRQLIPPQTEEEALALAQCGPMVLRLLPDPRTCTADEREYLASALSRAGGDEAIPYLGKLASFEESPVDSWLLSSWFRFDTAEYFREVISPVVARSPERAVAVQSAVELATVTGSGLEVRSLYVAVTESHMDLSGLSRCISLERLSVVADRCEDLVWPADMPAVEELSADHTALMSLIARNIPLGTVTAVAFLGEVTLPMETGFLLPRVRSTDFRNCRRVDLRPLARFADLVRVGVPLDATIEGQDALADRVELVVTAF
ncbi:putative signal transduction protein with Nacht domain [Streptomyces sp. Tu6071]|uniref:NACHT domain-containing protein n=1 Tax=Streptomyces sp. Tu6071 TaxID=355249 RepID=UPI00020E5288|nr:NACHT domain-containing protein [Streptomyces sp. Tu6071]EGJ73751.1 putative signal transduction protein with Nacht domain [Streptomyces sp. Tu6071]